MTLCMEHRITDAGLERLAALGALRAPEKAVRYDCGDAGQVVVSGGRSSPHGAALAMIKDTLGAVLEATTGFR